MGLTIKSRFTDISFYVFEVGPCYEKKRVVKSRLENIVKYSIWTPEKRRYTKVSLYQNDAKSRFNLQRQRANQSVHEENVRYIGVDVISRCRYIEVLLYLYNIKQYFLSVCGMFPPR